MLKIKFCTIPVADQDRALKFYTEKLGCEVLTDQPFGNGMRWIEVAWPQRETAFVLFTPPGMEDRVGGFSMASIVTDDIEKTYHEFTSRGVEFIEPPKPQPWGIQAIFKDSEGNSFVMTQEQ
ncbi:VOC family protein [Aneurinibacillus sp. Ricciae_BoGa-3]|uniref:VOC family protein n=1 Tax=Aneurinibacillus sp. Ricciae_BoGa-3 TaxID=3022697 RepID=UPI0023409F5F|nr:VOC family protein [Aneurinibacillus sp. Ricciae_BoGa-3]WCK54103.1 VOC family protein [Aneurinibacillus sp. Ricciae_BoGa-3]